MAMALEYEVKVPIDDVESVKEKITGVGGRLIGRRYEVDYYIDMRSCGNVPEDTVVRVRKVMSEAGEVTGELTFKGRRMYPDVKVREEITVSVNDPEKTVAIFSKLGFRVIKVEKEREVYILSKDVRICVDTVKGLGKFIEVEIMNPPSKDYFTSSLNDILAKLSLKGKEIIVKSYLEMLLGRWK
ncbi:MAG: class IV adenylate cyclase [Desulfurococcales archaeon]|nr:class IV adenylate cyclase [Desulfurococcales archaeon]